MNVIKYILRLLDAFVRAEIKQMLEADDVLATQKVTMLLRHTVPRKE